MSTRLLQTLTQANVLPGQTVVLAHALNVSGKAVVPDQFYFSADSGTFSYVGATTTTVTVRNDGLANATVTVLVVSWHSIIRVLGGGLPNLTPQPFVVGGYASASSPALLDQVFTYTHSGGASADFFINFAAAGQPDRPDTSYVAQVTGGGLTSILSFDCPTSNYATNQFRVKATGNVQNGDKLNVVIKQLT